MLNGDVKKIIAKLAQKNYYTARAYYQWNLRKMDHTYSDPPILVYQMGKVGSSSVTKTLREANIGRSIYHIHFLEPSLIDIYEKKRKESFSSNSERGLKHIWQYKHLLKELKKGWSKNKKFKIISLVREPIARNISDFFENIELLQPDLNSQIILKSTEYDFEISINYPNMDDIVEIFLKKFPHDSPLCYFDREFKGVLNVDIFSRKFDKSKGFQIFQEREFDILIIRLEDLNLRFGEAMKEFMGIDNMVLVNENLSINKEYDFIYQKFKNLIKFPETFLDKIYSSKFSRHFYNDEERQQFRKRWMEVT